MRFLKNYEYALKRRQCNHNWFLFDENNNPSLWKCSKCYIISEREC